MSMKVKRIVLAVSLLLASVWNCFCLFGLIPYTKWPFSLALPSVSSLIILVPFLFPSLAKADEKSRYYPELAKKEKVFAGITINFLFSWFVTVLACLVYPL